MSSTPPPPRLIGKYEVLGELGHGGMAVVYRARDPQLLRQVAVKVLHPHLANDSESRRRFLREARAAARLRHPNIVEVYDFAPDDGRESFMVSELLEGPTLRRFAEAHPGMPAEVVAAIGVVLCDALECAHREGVVHRDVKPDNILLQHDGTLKLTDFGIAHVADADGMTMTGQVLGSPAHMAPEQIEGGPVDARTDLFAMGTVLYLLSVGRLPFDAATPHALLRKILDVEYADPLRAAPLVGHRFADILRRCLARQPSERFANAAALREALTGFIAESTEGDPRPLLAEYFRDPEGFCEAQRARLLEALPALGLRARAAGHVPDALGYFNRALAIDPTNLRVLGLVRGIARRRRVLRLVRVAVVVSIAALATLVVVFLAVRAVRVKPRGRAHPRAMRLPEWHLEASTPSATARPSAAPSTEPSVAPSAEPTSARPSASARSNPAASARPRPTAAPATPVSVRLRFSPPGVFYGIDAGELREYDTAQPYVSLVPGAHRFRLVDTRGRCEETAWLEEIATSTLEVRRRFQCVSRSGAGGPSAAAPTAP